MKNNAGIQCEVTVSVAGNGDGVVNFRLRYVSDPRNGVDFQQDNEKRKIGHQ